jgi:hypothetical protein
MGDNDGADISLALGAGRFKSLSDEEHLAFRFVETSYGANLLHVGKASRLYHLCVIVKAI